MDEAVGSVDDLDEPVDDMVEAVDSADNRPSAQKMLLKIPDGLREDVDEHREGAVGHGGRLVAEKRCQRRRGG